MIVPDHRLPGAAAVLRPRPDGGRRQGLSTTEVCPASMLFPRGPAVAPHTGIELGSRRTDGFPGRWSRPGCSVRLAPALRASPLPPRTGPGLPLLGEHAHGRYTRPHLRGHRRAGGAATGRRRFTCTSLRGGRRAAAHRARRQGGGPGPGRPRLESLPGGSLRLRHALTNSGTDDYVLDGPRGRAARVADHLIEVLDFTGRHERERTPAAPRVDRRAVAARGRAPGARVSTAPTHGRRSARRASPRRTARCSACTSRGAATSCSVSSVTPPPAPRSAAASCCCRARCVLAPGESYATPWVHVVAADDGLDGLAAAWHAYQRSLPAHPAVQPVVLNVLGGGLLRPRPRPAHRDRRPGGRASASSGSCSTTAGSMERRDDTVGPRRLVGRPGRVARRAEPADRPRARARHGVRALDRAGDGQPRLRPRTASTPTGSSPPATARRCCTGTSRCST